MWINTTTKNKQNIIFHALSVVTLTYTTKQSFAHLTFTETAYRSTHDNPTIITFPATISLQQAKSIIINPTLLFDYIPGLTSYVEF